MAESGLVVSHGGVGEPTQRSEGEHRSAALGESTLLDPHGASGDLSHGLPLDAGVNAVCRMSGGRLTQPLGPLTPSPVRDSGWFGKGTVAGHVGAAHARYGAYDLSLIWRILL